MPPERLRESGWAPEDLRPVGGQPLDMLGVDPMGERVAQFGVLKAALVMGGGKGEEGLLAAGELE
jgi:hypothetical protein